MWRSAVSAAATGLLVASLSPLASACATSADCHGYTCSLPSPQSPPSSGVCLCTATRYDGAGHPSSDPTSDCSDTLASLSPSLYLTSRILLLTLFAPLLPLLFILVSRLRATDHHPSSPTFHPVYSCVLAVLSLLCYEAIDPLGAYSIIPLPASTFLLFFPDALALVGYAALVRVWRDRLLLSPLITDAHYNSLVKTDATLQRWLLTAVALVPLLAVAAAVDGVGTAYLAAAVAYAVALSGYTGWQLYGLASRDQTAVRRVSVISSGTGSKVPLPLPPRVAELRGRQESAGSLTPPVASALSTVALASTPSDSPHSLGAPSPLISASTRPSSRVSTNRRVSVVTAAGQKPVKAYSVERLNIRRLIRAQLALTAGLVAIYAALMAEVAGAGEAGRPFFAPSMSGQAVLWVHVVKGVWLWLWCLALVWTVWPSTAAVLKARGRRERRSTLHAVQVQGSGEREVIAGKETDSPAVKQATQGIGPDAAIPTLGEDDDEDDDTMAEDTREQAISLMSAAMAGIATGATRASLALAVSHSPHVSPVLAPEDAVDNPTSLLEPAAVFPGSLPALSAEPVTRQMPIRHSLPAIQMDPVILSAMKQSTASPPVPVTSPTGSAWVPPSSSSRAVRPTSAPTNEGEGGGGAGLLGLEGVAAGAGHEKKASRASSIVSEAALRETISPRTSSSRSSRQQRIFAPASTELEG